VSSNRWGFYALSDDLQGGHSELGTPYLSLDIYGFHSAEEIDLPEDTLATVTLFLIDDTYANILQFSHTYHVPETQYNFMVRRLMKEAKESLLMLTDQIVVNPDLDFVVIKELVQ
jgi:hypothetical protein